MASYQGYGGDDGHSATHTPATTIITDYTIYTIYYLSYLESLGSRSSGYLLVERVICAGLCYVTLYALVIHLMGTKNKECTCNNLPTSDWSQRTVWLLISK
jgi:hypothetical protein